VLREISLAMNAAVFRYRRNFPAKAGSGSTGLATLLVIKTRLLSNLQKSI
jgi:hypothetical protein